MAGQRDVPDTGQKFGASTGPLVWETFRSKVEIFNTTKDAAGNYAPPGYSATAQDLGYNTPPAYFYATKSVPACPGQAAPASPAWINLDETTEIALAQMFAGGPAIQDSANTSPQLVRYAVKANHVEYEYVADPKNQYFIPRNAMAAAANNKTAYTKSPPVAPTPPFISFKPGTVEIKSAWRPLNNNDQPARFHVQTVRFYENKGPNNQPCYFEQQWGLIALHIIQKTPSAPAFIYATFEQTDNIRQPNGTSVEDADGNVIQPIPGAAPTTPALAYKDLPTAPKVTATGPFCTPQNNLYFKDNPNDVGPDRWRCDLCQPALRANPARRDCGQQGRASGDRRATIRRMGSPVRPGPITSWFQFRPRRSMSPRFHPPIPSTARRCSIRPTSWSRRITRCSNFRAASPATGAPTALGGLPPPNVVTPAPTPPGVVGVNMGGCMGCHGNAQVSKGTDFSFILAEGYTTSPETPSALGDAALRTKYLNLFRR